MLNVLESSVEDGIHDIPNEVSSYCFQYDYALIWCVCNCAYIQEIVDVFNNILNETNEGGWRELQTISSGSQTLLQNAERYGTYLATTVNDTDEPLMLVRENISELNTSIVCLLLDIYQHVKHSLKHITYLGIAFGVHCIYIQLFIIYLHSVSDIYNIVLPLYIIQLLQQR